MIDAGESLLEYCPSFEDEETCRMSWQVNAAVVMLDKYVLAEEDNGGVPQPEKLSNQVLSDAEAAFQLLAEALGDGPPNDNSAASLIWARGAFVVGLARQGPGMYEDQDEATRMLTSALAHGYEPVGFREHVAAIEAVRRRSSGEGGQRPSATHHRMAILVCRHRCIWLRLLCGEWLRRGQLGRGAGE